MPGQRKDYILDQIELLRQFVARLADDHSRAGLEEALQLSLNLQEKLFPQPAPEFLRLPVDEQIAALRHGESPATGRGKCLAYARLLGHTGSLYEFRGRPDLAAGARQLALHIALSLALADAQDAETATFATGLLSSLDPLELHPPVRAMLDQFIRQAG